MAEAMPRDGRPDRVRRSTAAWAAVAALAIVVLVSACEQKPEPLGDRLADVRSRFEKVCSGCHPTEVPLHRRKSLSGWRDTVAEMRGKGAPLTDREAEEIAQYLALTRGL